MADQSDVHAKCIDIHGGLRLLFVRKDFFRKSGAQLLNVLPEFHNRGAVFEINVVSSLNY